MRNSKLDLYRQRDFDQLLTLTYEFLKQNMLQLAKFAFVGVLPFIVWSAFFGFDLLANSQLNIFELFYKLKLETAAFNPIVEPANFLAIVLYLIVVSVIGALSYGYIKLYKEQASIKKIKFKAIWHISKNLIIWLLIFNTVVFLLLASAMYFLGFLNIFITISYTLFVWGFTLLVLSFGFLLSSNVIALGSAYMLVFIFVLMPIFIFSFGLFMRFSLLLLYSVPLKLEEPNLNFTQRLAKCYQLLEGEAFKSWAFIHLVSIAVFFTTYVFSMPAYGLILKLNLLEQPILGQILHVLVKCFSYGVVVFVSGIMHLAISISFYSLYAKTRKPKKPKTAAAIDLLNYQIHENGF